MVPDLSTLLLFAGAAFALIVVPGPAVLYVVARSLEQGRVAGLVSVLGISVGAGVHVLAAALGLSALLASSVIAFSLVKYLGAAYLIYLGVRKLLSKPNLVSAEQIARQPLKNIFLEGIVVNLLNPQVALFFLAFLPQFVNPSQGDVGAQILLLGAIFLAVGVLGDGLYALLAGSFSVWLRRSRAFLRVQHYVSGAIYIALGVGAALSGGAQKR